ncbi:hypothetical protein GGI20_000474 [Coemansia sp. BCRC 34301]|nr:hypothetical protein GGI20_000474 [Coemansia sp. BCRC 34301]
MATLQSPFRTLPMLIVRKVVKYLEGRSSNSFGTDIDEHNKKKDVHAPLLSVTAVPELTSVTQGPGMFGGVFAIIAYLSSGTLKGLSIALFREDDASETLAEYACLESLTVDIIDTLYTTTWAAIEDAVPFPALSTLDVSCGYPFDDNVLFRSNGETMQNLSLPISALTRNALGRFNVLGRSGVGLMCCVSIDTISDIDKEFIAGREGVPIGHQIHSILKRTLMYVVARPPVLIPRWETEEWVLRLAELINSHTSNARDVGAEASRPLNILEACTGSGCIALGLGCELADGSARILGVDISDDAVGLAVDNLAFNQMLLSNHVQFCKVDLQQPVHLLPAQLSVGEGVSGGWDMIVSNPPYVTPSEYHVLDADVREWEDIRALVPLPQGTTDPQSVAEKDLDPLGMAFVVQLAKLAKELGMASKDQNNDTSLRMDSLPRLVVEIGSAEQAQSACQTMHDHGLNSTEVWKDMAGTDRVVLGYFKQ